LVLFFSFPHFGTTGEVLPFFRGMNILVLTSVWFHLSSFFSFLSSLSSSPTLSQCFRLSSVVFPPRSSRGVPFMRQDVEVCLRGFFHYLIISVPWIEFLFPFLFPLLVVLCSPFSRSKGRPHFKWSFPCGHFFVEYSTESPTHLVQLLWR